MYSCFPCDAIDLTGGRVEFEAQSSERIVKPRNNDIKVNGIVKPRNTDIKVYIRKCLVALCFVSN